MTFIDADVQFAYFQVSRERRKNREMYGAFIHSAIVGCLYFDRCLDMIICHHPDIWEYGTGSLLLANKIPILPTESEKRASCWREEALDKHKYSHLFNLCPIEVESFGFFVRKSLEYRKRIRLFICEIDINREIWDRFEYIDYMCPQVNEFEIKTNIVKMIGQYRHDIMFEETQLTKYQTNLQIYKEIEESVTKPTVEQLKDFLFDTHPYLFDERRVARKLFDLIPLELVYSKEKSECVVCLEEKIVIEWPCHSSHVTCEDCTIKIIRKYPKCPLCRKTIVEETIQLGDLSPITPFLWEEEEDID